MRSLIISILWLFPVFVMAKKESFPIWCTAEGREEFTPRSEYFSSFAQVRYYDKKGVQRSIGEAQEFAKKQLVEMIETNVKVVTENRHVEEVAGEESWLQSSYSSSIVSTANVNLVGLRSEYHVGKRDKSVYALAYVKKEELFAFYRTQLEKHLAKVEHEVRLADEALDEGDRAKSLSHRKEARLLLSAISEEENILVAVNSAKAAMVSAKVNQVMQGFVRVSMELDKAVRLYIQTEEDLFGIPMDVLSKRLGKELSAQNCVIVADDNDADYMLRVSAETRKADFNLEFKFAYADVAYELKNNKSGRFVLRGGFSYKGGGVSYEKAGHDALLRSSAQVLEAVKNELFE